MRYIRILAFTQWSHMGQHIYMNTLSCNHMLKLIPWFLPLCQARAYYMLKSPPPHSGFRGGFRQTIGVSGSWTSFLAFGAHFFVNLCVSSSVQLKTKYFRVLKSWFGWEKFWGEVWKLDGAREGISGCYTLRRLLSCSAQGRACWGVHVGPTHRE